MEHEEEFTVEGDSLTVEVEVESEYGKSTQRQTVSVSPGDTVRLKISDED